MRYLMTFLAIILALALTAGVAGVGKAQSGLPDSPKFGYGARVNLDTPQTENAIAAAANIQMDWIAINFDWNRWWPDGSVAPDLQLLNQAMDLATSSQINVMISISHAPAWATTPSGPNPSFTAYLVKSLADLYPDALRAIELFPAANTTAGWGATPDPVAYASLFQEVAGALKSGGSTLTLIAAGLTSVAPDNANGDWNDLAFLDGLYKAGAQTWMPIVSMRLPETSGDPMQAPSDGEHRCLRHYEEIRQVMLDNNHREGLIWLTEFSWPGGTITPSDAQYQNEEAQAHWLLESYKLLKAQLYMGAAFYSSLNPSNAESASPNSLIRADSSLHPAMGGISYLITPPSDSPDGPVQTVLVKRIVQPVDFKPIP